jgi:DNA-binding MarR family transcriptional regulator
VPEDRRSYALHLTDAGIEALEGINRIAAEHEKAIVSPLSPAERKTLSELLGRLADSHGLTPGVHPGFSRLGGRRAKPGE